jgi:hypothetical protein
MIALLAAIADISSELGKNMSCGIFLQFSPSVAGNLLSYSSCLPLSWQVYCVLAHWLGGVVTSYFLADMLMSNISIRDILALFESGGSMCQCHYRPAVGIKLVLYDICDLFVLFGHAFVSH